MEFGGGGVVKVSELRVLKVFVGAFPLLFSIITIINGNNGQFNSHEVVSP